MIFERWALVEADLHSVYGVDLGDATLAAQRGRTWRWLKLRIAGLCSVECRLSDALRPTDEMSTPSGAGQARPTAYDDPSD